MNRRSIEDASLDTRVTPRMSLREWIEAIAEGDVAPTATPMRRSRVGQPHVKTARRADKHQDNRSTAERHRIQKFNHTTRRITK